MSILSEKAVQNFKGGLNCAQAVVTAYAETLKIDHQLALSISCAFGGGMGRLQETCGAVTGSYMVLGANICRQYSDNKERKEITYALVQEFSKRFKEKHGSTDCIDLLGADLNTAEGQQVVRDKDLHRVVCDSCIVDAVNIVNELLH
jgi:C_GCAxxG_C_C family probable redox protein